ncbi:hypothetical protein CANCADRAFT_30295 [Tortispora caseinolytica NRRL Y-17796]|uniref:BZIP domain-containing protein n=1 Tax=Tortispora caseinolytica NRRL Y-17796 TaxID=767744 RepID=A0A1E4TJT5_9ASCO|nr:hypothetical protein CANCADRAFT_30295 [Tortispora caseinolytica NRRL Y-17796]
MTVRKRSETPTPVDPSKRTTLSTEECEKLLEAKKKMPPRKRAKTEDEKYQRYVERILRNRRSAHSSREKKRRQLQDMETTISCLLEHVCRLESKNTILHDAIDSIPLQTRSKYISEKDTARIPTLQCLEPPTSSSGNSLQIRDSAGALLDSYDVSKTVSALKDGNYMVEQLFNFAPYAASSSTSASPASFYDSESIFGTPSAKVKVEQDVSSEIADKHDINKPESKDPVSQSNQATPSSITSTPHLISPSSSSASAPSPENLEPAVDFFPQFDSTKDKSDYVPYEVDIDTIRPSSMLPHPAVVFAQQLTSSA